ncbi:MAG: hypothetical protein Q7J17_13150, partial [Candidatus Deferrimicrobium sp.]
LVVLAQDLHQPPALVREHPQLLHHHAIDHLTLQSTPEPQTPKPGRSQNSPKSGTLFKNNFIASHPPVIRHLCPTSAGVL